MFVLSEHFETVETAKQKKNEAAPRFLSALFSFLGEKWKFFLYVEAHIKWLVLKPCASSSPSTSPMSWSTLVCFGKRRTQRKKNYKKCTLVEKHDFSIFAWHKTVPTTEWRRSSSFVVRRNSARTRHRYQE